MKYDFDAVASLPKLKQLVEGTTDLMVNCDAFGAAHIFMDGGWIRLKQSDSERLARFLYGTYIGHDTLSIPERTVKAGVVIATCLAGGIAIGLAIGYIL